ncbi:GNAT family N-acetyltransferase [Thalassoroseus pseudoceratinae]|uniref:GNAT family N-acetyltransferase n=1 Tax=Thalassoroseus pseudoceratinae TaxID=2713176 RepID=UPI00141F3718|nr:GNAT family N-acetyltransferase [Thalassoroseus pseudoceratinae]
MSAMILRAMNEADQSEVADLIYISINHWYQTHGAPAIFQGGPDVARVFYDVYNDLTPGCNVVAVHPNTGRIMGSCFYHPREHHLSLGIMTVHPNYFGMGVGGKLLRHIIEYADSHNYSAIRLTQSALNVDSFSLYNKAGFVPRYSYQDMFLNVPETGLASSVPGADRVRPATLTDVPQMAAVEMAVSGISREMDYRYCIENQREMWVSFVIEADDGTLDGFLIASDHPGSNMLGPCVARNEAAAVALIHAGFNAFPGRCPVCVIPMDQQVLVRQMYGWGAKNCEMHFCQVLGEFQPFRGVNIPAFLPETA